MKKGGPSFFTEYHSSGFSVFTKSASSEERYELERDFQVDTDS